MLIYTHTVRSVKWRRRSSICLMGEKKLLYSADKEKIPKSISSKFLFFSFCVCTVVRRWNGKVETRQPTHFFFFWKEKKTFWTFSFSFFFFSDGAGAIANASLDSAFGPDIVIVSAWMIRPSAGAAAGYICCKPSLFTHVTTQWFSHVYTRSRNSRSIRRISAACSVILLILTRHQRLFILSSYTLEQSTDL